MQSGTASLPSPIEVEIIVNEKTLMKFKINTTENLEHCINKLINKKYFPRFEFQLSCSAKFIKHVNGEVVVFHKWVKSEMNCNYSNENVHNTLIQTLDDEQLEGSVFQFQEIQEVKIEILKVNDY